MILLTTIIFTFVSLIQSFVSTSSTKKFFLNCFEISSLSYKDFGEIVDYREAQKSIIKHFLIIIIIYVCLLEIMICFYNIFFNETINVLGFIIYLPIRMLISTTALKFISMVKLVNLQLETIDRLINEVFKPQNVDIETIKCYVMPTGWNKSLSIQTRIRNIRKIYNIIFENAEIINRTMGLITLALFALILAFHTFSGYRILLAATGNFPVSKLGG